MHFPGRRRGSSSPAGEPQDRGAFCYVTCHLGGFLDGTSTYNNWPRYFLVMNLSWRVCNQDKQSWPAFEKRIWIYYLSMHLGTYNHSMLLKWGPIHLNAEGLAVVDFLTAASHVFRTYPIIVFSLLIPNVVKEGGGGRRRLQPKTIDKSISPQGSPPTAFWKHFRRNSPGRQDGDAISSVSGSALQDQIFRGGDEPFFIFVKSLATEGIEWMKVFFFLCPFSELCELEDSQGNMIFLAS